VDTKVPLLLDSGVEAVVNASEDVGVAGVDSWKGNLILLVEIPWLPGEYG